MVKQVVIICTSASMLNGHKTGVWMEELASPYYIFQDAGYHIIIASIQGGPIPIDTNSMIDDTVFTESSRRFLHDPMAMNMMNHSISIDDMDITNIDGIFLPGGHGTCVDFIHNPNLQHIIETLYNSNKVIASVCHGPLCLCDCMTSDGTTPFVSGKVVTGFSDSEEVAVQLQSIVPYLLESKLKELGALYEKGDDWNSKVCIDHTLITGQNPQSSEDVAKAMVSLLGS